MINFTRFALHERIQCEFRLWFTFCLLIIPRRYIQKHIYLNPDTLKVYL